MKSALQIENLLDFSSYMDEHLEHFTGREWIFNEIREFLQFSSHNTFILVGDPGIGKTALVSRFIRSNPNIITAYHFCSARRGGWVDPIAFTKSLTVQISLRYEEYTKIIADLHGISLNIDVDINVQHLEGGNIIGILIDKIQIFDSEDYFNHFIREPLKVFLKRNPNIKITIIVDGLDEAMAYQGSMENIVGLLAKAYDFSQNVRFILTTRDETRVLRYWENLPHFRLYARYNENLNDVSKYIKNRIEESDILDKLSKRKIELEPFVEQLKDKSDGNFLYISYLMTELINNFDQLEEYINLPGGIDGIYRTFLDREIGKDMDHWFNHFLPLLGILAVSQDAVSEDHLCQFAGLDNQLFWHIVQYLWQFLSVEKRDDTQYFRLYHRSFVDFLSEKSRALRYWIDLANFHKKLAGFYLDAFKENKSIDNYGLQYLPRHLYEANSYQKLWSLVENSAWLKQKQRSDPSLYSYINDLGLAIQSAENLELSGLPFLIGFSILYTILKYTFREIPDEFLEALIECGEEKKAISVIEGIYERSTQLKAYCAIIPSLAKKGETVLIHNIINSVKISIEYISKKEDQYSFSLMLAKKLYKADLKEQAKQIFIELIRDPMSHGKLDDLIKCEDIFEDLDCLYLLHNRISDILDYHIHTSKLEWDLHFPVGDHEDHGEWRLKGADDIITTIRSTIKLKHNYLWRNKLVSLIQKVEAKDEEKRYYLIPIVKFYAYIFHLNEAEQLISKREKMSFWSWEFDYYKIESDIDFLLAINYYKIKNYERALFWFTWRFSKDPWRSKSNMLLTIRILLTIVFYHECGLNDQGFEYFYKRVKENEICKEEFRNLFPLIDSYRLLPNINIKLNIIESKNQYVRMFFDMLITHCHQLKDKREKGRILDFIVYLAENVFCDDNDIDLYLNILRLIRESDTPKKYDDFRDRCLNTLIKLTPDSDKNLHLSAKVALELTLNDWKHKAAFILNKIFRYVYNKSSVDKLDRLTLDNEKNTLDNDWKHKAAFILNKIFRYVYNKSSVDKLDRLTLDNEKNTLDKVYTFNIYDMLDLKKQDDYSKEIRNISQEFLSYLCENDFEHTILHMNKIDNNELKTKMIIMILTRFLAVQKKKCVFPKEDYLRTIKNMIESFWSKEDKINALLNLFLYYHETQEKENEDKTYETLFELVNDYSINERRKNFLEIILPYLPVLLRIQKDDAIFEKLTIYVKYLSDSELKEYSNQLIDVLTKHIEFFHNSDSLIDYIRKLLKFARNTQEDIIIELSKHLLSKIKKVDEKVYTATRNNISKVNKLISSLSPEQG